MTREDVKNVIMAQGILNLNLYRNQVDPSDLTDDEYNEEVFKIATDEDYRKELKEENDLG